MNKSIIIYDIEILKAVPPKDATQRLLTVDYCEGWHDHAGMGISCICAYDYLDERYRVFTEGNFEDFKSLCDARELIVGFNSIPFDNSVVKAFMGYEIVEGKSYDILREVWAASGLGPKFEYPSHARFGLDACCQVNFGTTKTGNGALAPVDWQRGRFGAVIDYCINDVKLTKQLFDEIVSGRPLKSPVSEKALSIRVPE